MTTLGNDATHIDDPAEKDQACSVDATCAEGGSTHCRMYERYPEALDDAGDGCCVAGCFLDVDGVNVK